MTDTSTADSINKQSYELFQQFGADPEKNIQSIVQNAFELFDVNSCCYCRFAGKHTALRAWRGKPGIPSPSEKKPLKAALCYNALKDKGNRPRAIKNLKHTPVKSAGAEIDHVGCASFLGCPITSGGRTIGAFCMFDKRERTYSRDEIQIAALTARILALEEERFQAIEGFQQLLDAAENKSGAALSAVKEQLEKEIRERKQTARLLEAKKIELAQQNAKLEEMSSALSVLVHKRNEDIKRIEAQMAHNIRELIDPSLQRLKNSRLTDVQRRWLDVLEGNLSDIASPLVSRLSTGYRKLTPTEIKVAAFIKYGKTNKEISDLLNISNRTVEVHRCNIRKKLGLTGRSMNLRTHLLSME